MENRVQRYYRIAGVGYRISLPEQCAYPTDGILAPYRVEELEPARTVDFFCGGCADTSLRHLDASGCLSQLLPGR